MYVDPSVLAAIRSAVETSPADIGLRTHLAQLLLQDGQADSALSQAEVVLMSSPAHVPALEVAAQAASIVGDERATAWYQLLSAMGHAWPVPPGLSVPQNPPSTPPSPSTALPPGREVAASGLTDSVPDTADELLQEWGSTAPMEEPEVGHLQRRPFVTLGDVGGMAAVKERLNQSFLAPVRHPELRERFGKSLRGGLMLWGPPGCGKTFIARAVAGELGASFYEVGIADVLEMWIGSSERNLHSVFEVARRNTPCVLFFDELDALGHKRTHLRSTGSAMRGVVNQLLAELDGATANNEGVFVLAATNHPWDVDPAVLRPGRIDRTVLVLPPDRVARSAVLATHLRDRPLDRVDLDALARRTEGFSGADLALVCEAAVEAVLNECIQTGIIRNVRHADLEAAVRNVRPSIGGWMETAKNFATYSDGSGDYDELLRYLKQRR
jgi:AAA+ superfamily predicted ATPase